MTPAQTALFWRQFSAACSALGHTTTADREEYRHAVLREEAGVESMKELADNGAIDRVLARFAADAQDYQAAANYATGGVRRLAALVKDCIVQVLLLADNPADPSAYLRGILRQSLLMAGRQQLLTGGDGDLLLDIDERSIRKVFMMLDTHRRRLLRRAGVEHVSYVYGMRQRVVGGRVVPAEPLGYEIAIRCRAA